jgi:hypothetical protein
MPQFAGKVLYNVTIRMYHVLGLSLTSYFSVEIPFIMALTRQI